MPDDQTKIVLTDGENIIVDLSVAAVSAELDQAVPGSVEARSFASAEPPAPTSLSPPTRSSTLEAE